MTFFKTRFIIISKFNPVTLKTKNIDETFSTCSKCVCFEMNLYFANWQFYELLQQFAVLK